MFFKEQRKKSVAALSPGIPITFSNTNHKLTTYMKATKVTNIQIRLLVEESQQLNSKKWKQRKWYLSQNIYKKNKVLNATNKKKSKKKPLNFFLTIYHSYSFVILLFQQRCQVKLPPWSLEDLPIVVQCSLM